MRLVRVQFARLLLKVAHWCMDRADVLLNGRITNHKK